MRHWFFNRTPLIVVVSVCSVFLYVLTIRIAKTRVADGFSYVQYDELECESVEFDWDELVAVNIRLPDGYVARWGLMHRPPRKFENLRLSWDDHGNLTIP